MRLSLTYARISVEGFIRYKHGVIRELIAPALLRSVRTEVQENLSFTPKETDIYKIHQSGDLANLDGLDDSSLKLLPSLLKLRDALYSTDFREYLSKITGSGPLSGKKTDMAINVYTPGCHLLCHDDVIGSRRVSYILYLTDPDRPWKPEWGGALRLYPTETFTGTDGQPTKTPSPDFSVSIPPAFNQLSFFAVQPGESFHDVEEVYARTATDKEEDDGGRVRMAISGWYHIPQEGEDGYEEGLEEKLAEKSSLVQLQGKADRFDLPMPKVRHYEESSPGASDEGKAKKAQSTPDDDDDEPTEQELDFLLKYITPTYLTPDTLAELSDLFADESSLRLDTFLSRKFSTRLRQHLESQESQPLPSSTSEIENQTPWRVARPPHKHRFLYQQPRDTADADQTTDSTPLQELLEDLLPSTAFWKWLAKATGLALTSYDLLARRFRRGVDYTLATGYEEEGSRLEITLGVTPSSGWGDDGGGDGDGDVEKGTGTESGEGAAEGDGVGAGAEHVAVGGYEVYMAGDEDDDDDAGSDHGVILPSTLTGSTTDSQSDLKTKSKTKPKSDPAIYKPGADDQDDGVLFSMPASWNKLSIVLRDKGVLRFVKFVGREARGDRWDVGGWFGVEEDEGDGEEEEVGKGVAVGVEVDEDEDEDQGWEGFGQSSGESESD